MNINSNDEDGNGELDKKNCELLGEVDANVSDDEDDEKNISDD